MKKMKIRTLSVIIIGTMIGTTNLQYVSAAEPSVKEEVVYANLDGNGVLQGTYIVNIFHGKDITDYGNYSRIKNMNTTDKISYVDGMVSITSSEEQLYYEGILENAELPWNIEITYALDGINYTAEEMAGKSGKLSINIVITENMNIKEGFFENYALQISVKLDSSICKNISAEGSTQANTGNMKQFTYTVMPGKDKNIEITADVTDFEMESIQINGIRLDLGIDSSSVDSGKLNDKINDLQSAVTELDDGADDLKDGADGLNAGAIKLKEGIETIQQALNTLNSSSANLTTGSGNVKEALSKIQSSLKTVNISADELNKLSNASIKLKEGINGLVGGLQSMDGSIDTYYTKQSEAGLSDIDLFVDKHKEAITALGITDTQRSLYNAYISGGESGASTKLGELVKSGDTEAVELYQKAAEGDKQVITNYITAAGKLISVETLLKADISYIQGSEQLISGIDDVLDMNSGTLMTGALTLQTNYTAFHDSIENLVSSLGSLATNMNQLKTGIDQLNNNYDALDNGILDYTDAVEKITDGYVHIYDGAFDMVNGTSELYNGTKSLADGTEEFVNETADMNDEIENEIDEMLNEYTGSDYEVKSFVSDKNTKVESVQFVIKTAAVEKIEIEAVAEEKEQRLNLWQKFLRLFGLY